MKLASFDIFDTTLIRKCGKPINIFYLLAHKLYPNDCEKREAFFEWRKGAERGLSAVLGGRETTINDIYNSNIISKFKEYSRNELIEAEKAIEIENLVANPEIKTVIADKRNQGYTVCFISDMYLDSETLEKALRREGCLEGEEKVFVSCEEGARKSTGALYNVVCKRLNPDSWEHYGDHPISDLRRAKEAGVKAKLVGTPFTTTEQSLCNSNNYALSCLAGLQRAARIINGNSSHDTLATDFVAAAYIPYIHFILENAKKEGIERLYFLSRDGYILQKIAEEWQTQYPEIELKYLFVSRKALLLPYLTNATADKFLAIQDKHTITGKKIKELLLSLGIESEDVLKHFEYEKVAKKEQESDFLNKVFRKESALRKQINKAANEKRSILNSYFIQEGLFDNKKNAMVDVGWLGTTRLMINSILREEGCNDTKFFYYGMRGDALSKECGTYSSYLSSQEISTELTALVEHYFSASPYPSTIGYIKEQERITPIFEGNNKFRHNRITTANISISTWLSREISTMGAPLTPALNDWGQHAINDITALKNSDIDVTPLVEAAEFEGKDFVRRMSRKELIKRAIGGRNCTAYDKASVKLSVNSKYYPPIWKCCKISGRIRRFIYLSLNKHKR